MTQTTAPAIREPHIRPSLGVSCGSCSVEHLDADIGFVTSLRQDVIPIVRIVSYRSRFAALGAQARWKWCAGCMLKHGIALDAPLLQGTRVQCVWCSLPVTRIPDASHMIITRSTAQCIACELQAINALNSGLISGLLYNLNILHPIFRDNKSSYVQFGH